MNTLVVHWEVFSCFHVCEVWFPFIRVKLVQNWDSFGNLLKRTGDHQIVEDSHRDVFWGAKADDEGRLIGSNLLGQLLMELREELENSNRKSFSRIKPLSIPDFLLYSRSIELIAVP